VVKALHHPLTICIAPAAMAMVVFEIWLGHRHDYTGHFAAGYGATLAAGMFGLRVLPADRYSRLSACGLLPLCLGCILLGVLTEATIFRLAKFDEIDFCNQSLGAVLAAICLSPLVGREQPPASSLDAGLVTGIAFVGVGACYAVA
jgi:hypothetical protein